MEYFGQTTTPHWLLVVREDYCTVRSKKSKSRVDPADRKWRDNTYNTKVGLFCFGSSVDMCFFLQTWRPNCRGSPFSPSPPLSPLPIIPHFVEIQRTTYLSTSGLVHSSTEKNFVACVIRPDSTMVGLLACLGWTARAWEEQPGLGDDMRCKYWSCIHTYYYGDNYTSIYIHPFPLHMPDTSSFSLLSFLAFLPSSTLSLVSYYCTFLFLLYCTVRVPPYPNLYHLYDILT